jgi:hypothetical protein
MRKWDNPALGGAKCKNFNDYPIARDDGIRRPPDA